MLIDTFCLGPPEAEACQALQTYKQAGVLGCWQSVPAARSAADNARCVARQHRGEPEHERHTETDRTRRAAIPPAQRAELADSLVESLVSAPPDDIQRLWMDEASKCLDEVRSGPIKTIPGEEVLAEARRLVKR